MTPYHINVSSTLVFIRLISIAITTNFHNKNFQIYSIFMWPLSEIDTK